MHRCKIALIRPTGTALLLACTVLASLGRTCHAQQPADSHPVDLGILVTSSQSEADAVLKQLNAGFDFSVLAKEKSIDSTAVDGGYMGNMSIDQLRPEFQAALKGHSVGQITTIVPISSGFAILKILSAPPPLEDMKLDHIAQMYGSGDLRLGPSIGGFSESIVVFKQFPKPDGWNHDLKQSCDLRTQSWDYAIDRMTKKSSPTPSLAPPPTLPRLRS